MILSLISILQKNTMQKNHLKVEKSDNATFTQEESSNRSASFGKTVFNSPLLIFFLYYNLE